MAPRGELSPNFDGLDEPRPLTIGLRPVPNSLRGVIPQSKPLAKDKFSPQKSRSVDLVSSRPSCSRQDSAQGAGRSVGLKPISELLSLPQDGGARGGQRPATVGLRPVSELVPKMRSYLAAPRWEQDQGHRGLPEGWGGLSASRCGNHALSAPAFLDSRDVGEPRSPGLQRTKKESTRGRRGRRQDKFSSSSTKSLPGNLSSDTGSSARGQRQVNPTVPNSAAEFVMQAQKKVVRRAEEDENYFTDDSEGGGANRLVSMELGDILRSNVRCPDSTSPPATLGRDPSREFTPKSLGSNQDSPVDHVASFVSTECSEDDLASNEAPSSPKPWPTNENEHTEDFDFKLEGLSNLQDALAELFATTSSPARGTCSLGRTEPFLVCAPPPGLRGA